MRLIINLVLLVIVAVLIWMLYSSIREPIAFSNEKNKREDAVIAKLTTIRTAQELFRSIKGGFAPNFDTLAYVLKNDSFSIIKVNGDPDDPNFNGVITYDTSLTPAYDSIQALGINLDSLPFVPYGGGTAFNIQADTITYQSTTVNVVEVGIPRKVFMGAFGDIRFAKYDQNYDPNKPIKFGNMNAPNLAGNWER